MFSKSEGTHGKKGMKVPCGHNETKNTTSTKQKQTGQNDNVDCPIWDLIDCINDEHDGGYSFLFRNFLPSKKTSHPFLSHKSQEILDQNSADSLRFHEADKDQNPHQRVHQEECLKDLD